jgi:hypothetical protein
MWQEALNAFATYVAAQARDAKKHRVVLAKPTKGKER